MVTIASLPKRRTRRKLLTADELLRLAASERCYELVKGELFEMPPPGARHGSVAMEIGALLRSHVRANAIGSVFAAKTGFLLARSPDTVRAPDVSFVSGQRLPKGGLPDGYLELAPDLVVEVLSPSDRPGEVRDKVANWLAAGTRLVWVIDPSPRTVRVYRSPEEFELLGEGDLLEGGELIPGFSCDVSGLVA